MINGKKIQIVFPNNKSFDAYLPKDMTGFKNRDFFNLFTADLDEVMQWFGKHTVESIELVINSVINTHEETKLIVGTKEDQQGVKISLKPRPSDTSADIIPPTK